MRPDRFAIARALHEIAALLSLSRANNPFRAKAYERAAEALEDLEEDLDELIAEDRLTSVRGIGDAIASQIEELRKAGSSSVLEKLRAEHPPGVLDLVKVPGLGVKKIAALHAELGVSNVEELEEAARSHRVRTVRGFSANSEGKILAAIEAYRGREERLLYVEAMPIARRLLEAVRRYPGVEHADLAGELRRGLESVARIEIVASTRDRAAVAERFGKSSFIERVESVTDDRVRVRHGNGLHVDLHLVSPPSSHATALLLHTGPREHVAALARIAAGGKLTGKTEEAIYSRLGLAFVPPELRDDPDAIARADKGEITLLEEGDLRGLVHCHTDWSDGRDDLLAMARAAEDLGAAYITITDHSAAAHYAGGLDVERLQRQWDAIAEVQEQVKVRLLRGTEADILADGALDWPDRILEQLDVVIASVHSGFKMDEDAMTKRLVRAMAHPVFKIWGHALGRLVERRRPYAVRMEEVLDAIAESRTAIELNGDPYRLDPEPKWIRLARRRDIKFVVSTDAHSASALRNAHFGAILARRGGLSRDDVLNTRDVRAFMRAVRPAA